MKNPKIKLTLLAFVFSILMAEGQVESPGINSIKSNNVSIGLNGAPTWPIGISYSQMLNNRVAFEIGAGILSAGAGFNFYITNPQYHRLNLYTGLFASINTDGYGMFYLPVGITYFGKKNFQYSVDVGVLSAENVSMFEDGTNPSPWFGLKVGYRFGDDVETVKQIEKTTKKNIISVQLSLTDVLVGVIYERLITPFLGLEAGLGFFGASVGARVYFPAIRTEKLGFHLGVSQSVGYFGNHTYFPVGINWLSQNNFMLSFDAGPQLINDDNNSVMPSFSFRVGKAF